MTDLTWTGSARRWFLGVVAATSFAAMAAPALAGVAETDAKGLVDKSRATIASMLIDPEVAELKGFIDRARAVLIIPQLVKGGFIIGGEGGSGVLMVKADDGTWSPPAFFVLAAGSIGLQIGGQVSEVVFTIMNDGAVDSILNSNFKLGADASVAVGPIGKGVEASTTTNLKADIYAFSRVVGLFGGGALEGAAILPRDEWNQGYYGAPAAPKSIVLERRFYNTHADPLRQVLAQ